MQVLLCIRINKHPNGNALRSLGTFGKNRKLNCYPILIRCVLYRNNCNFTALKVCFFKISHKMLKFIVIVISGKCPNHRWRFLPVVMRSNFYWSGTRWGCIPQNSKWSVLNSRIKIFFPIHRVLMHSFLKNCNNISQNVENFHNRKKKTNYYINFKINVCILSNIVWINFLVFGRI